MILFTVSGPAAGPQGRWNMLARTMGREQVPFPQDCTNWLLVRDLLTDLQEHLLNETINAYDAALRVQVCG